MAETAYERVAEGTPVEELGAGELLSAYSIAYPVCLPCGSHFPFAEVSRVLNKSRDELLRRLREHEQWRKEREG